MGLTAPSLACLSFLLARVACEEMAFVDVTATEGMTVRYLDIPIGRKAGIAGLFDRDPMLTHDFSATAVVDRTVGAVVRAAAVDGSAIAREVKAVGEQLASLYAILAKNNHSRLDKGAVRYALRRHFDDTRGWSIKGLEPAGGAWVNSMKVNGEVRQLSKYIIPAYVMEKLFTMSGGKGLDSHWLSVFAVIMDRLIHAEMAGNLYDVFTTLDLPIAGQRSNDELERIALTFAMVYTLGTDLEVSTKRATERLDDFLHGQHGTWRELKNFTDGLLARERPATADFAGMLHFVERWATEIAGWQSRDCKFATDVVQGLAGFDRGRVPLESVRAHTEPGHRELFTQSVDHMRSLGIVDGEHLVLANYLLSQDMCMATSSFYSICCPDACNQKLALLERSLMSHSAGAGAIADALGATPERRASLEAAAKPFEGRVELHGPALARWLHESFPTECPAPSDKSMLNPRTADEWMAVPGTDVKETEELIADLSVGVSNFVKMGLKGDSWQESPEDSELPVAPVETILGGGSEEHPVAASGIMQTWIFTAVRLCIAFVLFRSMGMAVHTALCGAAGRAQDCLNGKAKYKADDLCSA